MKIRLSHRALHAGRFLLWLTLLMLAGISCATPSQRRYFTVSTAPNPAPAKTRFPVDIWVKEVDIAPVYNRPQIVYRYSPSELQYYNASNWADRPARMVTQMLTDSLEGSGLFRTVTTRLGTSSPTYTLEGTVQAIEELDAGDAWFAHLAMNMQLVRFKDQQVLWQYSFNERRPLTQRDLALVVRALSEIYQDQIFTVVLPQIEAVLAGKTLPVPAVQADVALPVQALPLPTAAPGDPAAQTVVVPVETPASSAAPPAIEGRSKPDDVDEKGSTARLSPTDGGTPSSNVDGFQRVNWRKHHQYTSDPTQVPAGKGAIFLPALSDQPDREPEVGVYRESVFVTSGSMGRRIVVSPGSYHVYFGSGALAQRMVRDVVVKADQTTIVQGDWSTLDVSVMDDKFIPFRGSYELIRVADREFMGTGYGADEELGEQTMIWLLTPGLYKIVQPGSTYRARTNFATVQLQPGTLVPFTLVLDTTTHNFLGAGVAEAGSENDRDKVWSLRVSIGGTALANQRSAELSNAGTSLAFQLFSDNLLRYSKGRHLWSTRLDIEEGQTLQSITQPDGAPGSILKGQYRYVPLTDRAYFNSIYIYRLLPWVGPYLRVGADTQLFNSTQYLEAATAVSVLDAEGNFVRSIAPDTRVKLSGPFSPLEFRQGVGANFRLFHNTHLDMDLRGGVGLREYLANGHLRINDNVETPDQLEVQADANKVQAGPEVALLASARITRYVQFTTDFDSLVSFQQIEGENQTQFKWRNTVNLRLASYASLAYYLNLDRNPNIGLIDPVTFEHGIQLRFAFTPF